MINYFSSVFFFVKRINSFIIETFVTNHQNDISNLYCRKVILFKYL